MPNEENKGITFEEQQMLDVFVLKVKSMNEVNPRWNDIVSLYDAKVRERSEKAIQREKENTNKVLQMRMSDKANKSGLVLTLSIIEISLVVGLFMAFLILALI